MSSVASSSSTPFQNIYYARKAGTERPCYICRRPTSTVLATIKTEDFLYTCEGHLTDPGFASPISPPPAPNGPSAEEIRKVIADYNAREAKKSAKEKADKDDSKEKDKDKAKENKDKGTESPDLSNVPNLPVSTSPPPSTHRKFALHRQIFDMRRAEIRRKEQGVKAKEVSKGLPQVPRGAF